MADTRCEVRHFACTACGKCCTRGPEIELGEATALADTFIMTLLLKFHGLPLATDVRASMRWWKTQGSDLPVRAAVDEARRHLRHFSSQERLEKSHRRTRHLEISALTFDVAPGRCPALAGEHCSIYDVRPASCRTVPLHYSRPPSVLRRYLDGFVATPGHRCNASVDAPEVLDGLSITDPILREARRAALHIAEADRRWKDRIVAAMREPGSATGYGLPTDTDVLHHSDAGMATIVSMLVAWRIARDAGMLSCDQFRVICKQQVDLIDRVLAATPAAESAHELTEMRVDYMVELLTSKHRSIGVGRRRPQPPEVL